MKRLSYGLLILASLATLSSCNEESWVGPAGTGGIRINLKTSGEVKDAVPVLRAADGSIDVPDVSEFGIRLEKADGSYSSSWQSLEAFRKEEGFAAGQYTITAFYGDINEEGFELPCFEGSASLYVMEDKETTAEITAALVNTMVSVDYTDAFRNYFSSWSAQVHSEGHDFISFAADETRPAFLTPGTVAVALSMTNQSGKEVTIQPAEFLAEARHHYHLTFDVNNGQVGQAQLVIKFDDSLVQEDVEIDLTDELFTSPAPEVKGIGFAQNETIEMLEGNPNGTLKYQMIARGGLKNATLTINSDSYTPAFGNEIDLMSANATERQQITAAGINCAGLWKNPDQMALVDLSDFCGALPVGSHKITLVAKDKFTRISEPVSVTINVLPIKIDASVSDIILGSENAAVTISYNGPNPEKAFSFEVLNNVGKYEPCEIISCEEVSTRSFEQKDYRFTLRIPDTERSTLPVKIYFNGSLLKEITINVIAPNYNVDVDAFATLAYVSVNADEPEHLSGIVNNLHLYLDGNKVAESNIVRDVEHGRVMVKGLSAAKTYELKTNILSGDKYNTTDSFTTESMLGVPNGDFESLATVIDNITLNQGGTYYHFPSPLNAQNKETFNISEPTGWATVNAKTFNTSAATQNTWFVYPSTINVAEAQSGSTAMSISSVGYDYNGSVPGRYASSSTYSHNKATVANRAAGKLFLGSYSINTSNMSENYNQGVSFAARPVALQGYYKYAPDASDTSDKGLVTVKLYAGSILVAQGVANFSAAGSYSAFNVPLTYEVHGLRPDKLQVMFASSNKASESAADETSNVVCTAYTSEQHQSYIGSTLTIDNLSFSYGVPSFKAKAKKAVIRKKASKR